MQQCTKILFIHLDRRYTCSKHKELKTKQKDFKNQQHENTTPMQMNKNVLKYHSLHVSVSMYTYIICLDNFFCQTSFLIRHVI